VEVPSIEGSPLRADLNNVDSAILGGAVFEVRDLEDGDDFGPFERDCILPAAPRLAIAKVAASDIAGTRHLEDHGFRFAEFQIELIYRMRTPPEVGSWPYRWEAITDEEGLSQVLALADTIFAHDRYTTDPDIGPKVSGARYQAYVRRSFATDEEFVYAMRAVEGGPVLSFATFRRMGGTEVRLLVGGVAEHLKGSGLGVIHDRLGLATYWNLGIRTLHTAVSGHNIPILTLEVAHLGFKPTRSWVVLHKNYLPGGIRR